MVHAKFHVQIQTLATFNILLSEKVDKTLFELNSAMQKKSWNRGRFGNLATKSKKKVFLMSCENQNNLCDCRIHIVLWKRGIGVVFEAV